MTLSSRIGLNGIQPLVCFIYSPLLAATRTQQSSKNLQATFPKDSFVYKLRGFSSLFQLWHHEGGEKMVAVTCHEVKVIIIPEATC